MKIWSAVLIGFVLGITMMFLSRPVMRVRASGLMHLHVYEVPKGGDMIPGTIQGTQVVGFSCVPTDVHDPYKFHCFVAVAE